MQMLPPDDPDWLATFPCRVAPSPDEWLVSLLLRCDEVNQWESGETFRYLLRSTNHPRFGPKSSLLVVPFPLLECFAQVLAISPQCLVATTYSRELARLYPSSQSHSSLLLGPPYQPENRSWKFRQRQREFGRKHKIHLCPACIAERRLIRRTATLPYLQSCPIHRIAFQERCSCGTSLVFFSRGTPPFTCSGCGLDWAQWPKDPLKRSQETLQPALSALYGSGSS